MEFKNFILENETNMKDVNETLKKIPKKHKNLLKGYKYIFQPDNTLKNDSDHIGLVQDGPKTITLAAPWAYGREYTFLHEIGHIVWKHFVDKDLRSEWNEIVKKTKDLKQKDKQNIQELFCMAYSSCYCTKPISSYNHDEWIKFVEKLK